MIRKLNSKACISAVVAIQIHTVYPNDCIAEDPLKFNEDTLPFPFGLERKLLSIPTNVINRFNIGMSFFHKTVIVRIGIPSRKRIGKGGFLKRNRPIVRNIHVFPITVIIKSCGCTSSITIFVKAKCIELIHQILKCELPIFIKGNLFHDSAFLPL